MIRKQTLLDEEEVERINRICERENRSFSNMLRCLVKYSLENYKDEYNG